MKRESCIYVRIVRKSREKRGEEGDAQKEVKSPKKVKTPKEVKSPIKVLSPEEEAKRKQ